MAEDTEHEDPAADLLDRVQIEPDDKSTIPIEGSYAAKLKEQAEARNTRPSMTSEKWADYAMSHFTDDELIEGCPTVDGLRRVAEKLLGPILHSGVTHVFPASPENDFRATVVYSVSIKFAYPEDGDTAYRRNYEDVADVYPGNTDPEFARYPAATAATRAEARTYRKALRLRRVVSAEELTSVPVENSGIVENSSISTAQLQFLVTIAKRNNINLGMYVSGYATLYKIKNFESIPYNVGVKMVAKLSEWQRDVSKIPPKLLGYEQGWKEQVKYYV